MSTDEDLALVTKILKCANQEPEGWQVLLTILFKDDHNIMSNPKLNKTHKVDESA